jgi:hypothetical protein
MDIKLSICLIFQVEVNKLFGSQYPCGGEKWRSRKNNDHWTKVTLQETAASPSAKCTRGRPQNTRGSLPRVQHSGKSFRGCPSRERGLPRVPKIVHSGKPSPSVVLALGEDFTPSVPSARFCFFKLFPECCTRGRNLSFLKKIIFPECNTRGRNSIF